MREGSRKKASEQVFEIEKFFHGKNKTFLSQLKMSCDGSLACSDFHESTHVAATSKESTESDISCLILKPSLALNTFQHCRAGIEMEYLALEMKNLTGVQLSTRRTLLAMTRKGAQNFRKYNSFAEEKWDTKKGDPKESGNAIEDIVNHDWYQTHESLQGRMVAYDDEHEMENEQNFCLATKINDYPDDIDAGGIKTGENDNDNDPESTSNRP